MSDFCCADPNPIYCIDCNDLHCENCYKPWDWFDNDPGFQRADGSVLMWRDRDKTKYPKD